MAANTGCGQNRPNTDFVHLSRLLLRLVEEDQLVIKNPRLQNMRRGSVFNRRLSVQASFFRRCDTLVPMELQQVEI
jgi:hypothetical protein